jgi:uncharacterized RDD family membrane protein YckC
VVVLSREIPSQLYCPICAAVVSPGAEFCGNCGSRFSGEVAVPSEATGEAQPPAGVIGIDYAGFWMRMLAFIIDAVPLVTLIVLVDFVTEDLAPRILLRVLILLSYFVGFWVATAGATPGKLLMGIRVVRTNGQPLDVTWGLVRFVGYVISLVLLLSGFIMIAFTPQKRGLHDYIAQTVVVRIR